MKLNMIDLYKIYFSYMVAFSSLL